MPWITFESIEHEKDRVSKTGKKYDCYVLHGTKKGYNGAPDEAYEKIFFDNSATCIIEKGVSRPNISVVQFLQKGVNPGDMLVIKNTKRQGRWELDSIENLTTSRGGSASDYAPITPEELNKLQGMQMQTIADPTRPAAPATPMMAPLNYQPATV
jgi:hypothetical protein